MKIETFQTLQTIKLMNIKTDKETVQYVYDILLEHQKGYSDSFVPERINKIREFMKILKKQLE